MNEQPETTEIVVDQRVITLNELPRWVTKVIKPHFQRKQFWHLLPVKGGTEKPNTQAYIDFILHATRHEANGISFGKEIHNNKDVYYIIDGNNRVNALMMFLESPLKIYPHFLEKMEEVLEPRDMERIHQCSLIEIQNFRKMFDIFPIRQFSTEVQEIFESEMYKIQSKLMYKSQQVQTVVKINLTIYENGNQVEYAKVFAMSNRYVSKLSENCLLAATLFHTKCNIKNYRAEINRHATDYYGNRDQNEVLSSECIQEFNVFDNFLGLQNFCHDICPWIPNFMTVHNNGMALFFKLFGCYRQCQTIIPTIFEDEIVNQFVVDMVGVAFILDKIRRDFLSFDGSSEFFSNLNIKSEETCLRTNNILLIMCTILALKKTGELSEEGIIQIVKRIVIYHFLCNAVVDSEKRRELVLYDGLNYQSGGKTIFMAGRTILSSNPRHIVKINEEDRFRELLHLYLLQEADNCNKRKFPFVNRVLYSFFPEASGFLINLSTKTKNANLYRLGNIKLKPAREQVFTFQDRKVLQQEQQFKFSCLENENCIEERVIDAMFCS